MVARWIALIVSISAWAAGCADPSVPSESPATPPLVSSQPLASSPVTSASARVHPSPPAEPMPSPVPRIGSLTQDAYIRARPDHKAPEIGTLDLGSTVALRQPSPVGTAGCRGGWYAVEPYGFLCHDGTTTLEPDTHPLMQAKRAHHLSDQACPYSWGESRFAPLYRSIPDAREQRRWEPKLDKHLAALEKLREARRAGASEDEVPTPSPLRGVDIFAASSPAPAFLANGNPSPWAAVHTPTDLRPRYDTVPARSSIAWTDEFFAEGRSWLLTPQLLLVPKDKVSIQKPSSYSGVRLSSDGIHLPLAFIRGQEKTKYRWEEQGVAQESASGTTIPAAWSPRAEFKEDADSPKGAFVATAETWKRLEHVQLTGKARWKRGKRYLETNEQGRWIRESDAVVVRGRPPDGLELREGEKWIDVSIHWGTLVAYEGSKPIFATLISPGLKGYARVQGKPAKNTSPTGAFRIEWKHLTRTMSPDPEKKTYYLSEVPFTQFFHLPFALHGAYWHDAFGEPKSGGCINLSVADAQWLFAWTEPALPEGWHAIRSGDDRGTGTWVVVR
ncbi:MAG TPA: L,D-transpeptidase family protein [Polyangiaceae bacterium]|nr:MAG: L,D-transpeptidase catalytic domain [Deltaproteobacteria bacterium ADurb.Bin207]HNS98430.1 L,D-transpeptidase family protein [Polyangiaceae bacterium]HNZ22740.1 L,D-transpeptidase family protein [Polyangiaceae bacterium]HOD24393.1 L,D-transpeptidase family protein [Polyangiaceae bacterium]HOE47638.1 L,D-transpeptidase family protein [Polyangiaceae bacterium]